MNRESGSTMTPEGNFNEVYVKKYKILKRVYESQLKHAKFLQFGKRKWTKKKIKYCKEQIKKFS